MQHIRGYLEWLEKNMTERKISPTITEVTTPFLDRHNDYTQVYIINQGNNKFKISDDGYIVNDLLISGVDVGSSDKRKSLFQQVLAKQAVQFEAKSGELYVISSQDALYEAQHRLLQTMLDVDDLFYTAKSTVTRLFLEEVTDFFKKESIFSTANMSVVGKSGFSHSYEFVLQRNASHPERFIRLMNNPDKGNVERVIFSWSDIKDSRDPDSKLYVLLNDRDKNNVDSIVNGLLSYDIEPFLWSERNTYINKFN